MIRGEEEAKRMGEGGGNKKEEEEEKKLLSPSRESRIITISFISSYREGISTMQS